MKAGAERMMMAKWPWLGWALCWMFGCAPVCAGADSSAPASPSPDGPKTLYLELRTLNEPLMAQNLALSFQDQAFKKEPDFRKHKIHRGFIKVGDETNQLAWIWDVQQGTLCLDLNRNLDLTDDPAGEHACPREFFSQRRQTFTNVYWTYTSAAGAHQINLDLTFNTYNQTPQCYAALRSFWEGKLDLPGRAWQVGLVENLTGAFRGVNGANLVLRPWEERGQPIRFYGSWVDTFNFPNKLFLEGLAWQVGGSFLSEGGTPKYRLDLKPQQPKQGQLEVSGSFLHRVALMEGEYTVVLDTPRSPVKLPVGTYNQLRILLKKGDAEAARDVIYMRDRTPVIITEQKPARLQAGGPLTNSVSVSRHGQNLVLNYQLLGAEGAGYQRVPQDRNKPPEFAVYRGDTKIGSGKFQYG